MASGPSTEELQKEVIDLQVQLGETFARESAQFAEQGKVGNNFMRQGGCGSSSGYVHLP